MTNGNENTESSNKNKQKPGLNAIRPDDNVERDFKNMAKNRNLSQTELFEYMFWSYINEDKENKKESALPLESFINLISNDLSNILNHFKNMADSAQNTVIAITTNSEQVKINLNKDIDSMKQYIIEMEKRNAELEKSNDAFEEIRSGLDLKITELNEKLVHKENENKGLMEKIKEYEKLMKDQEKQMAIKDKEISNFNNEVKTLQDAADTYQSKIKNLEIKNESLQSTLNSIEALKKAEISSIEAKNQAIVTDYENRIKSIENAKAKNLNEITQRLRIDFESKIKNLEVNNENLKSTIDNIDSLKKAEISSIEEKYKTIINDYKIKIKNLESNKSKELNELTQRLKAEFEADRKIAVADIKLELVEMKSKYNEALMENANLKLEASTSEKVEKTTMKE
ncbi:hypothetical protein IAI10_16515 [Clostridium sp. 19966]|uniref:hypothetical protein n=1 Tax=Clostridium sp. 19966 TaxID=2768166 RepID=UPI0028DE52B1|nr:hypothetical protein [Clostridium sp. 19966]MDT8718272.1 hypothetical protein [Clostridium sp. 19966]